MNVQNYLREEKYNEEIKLDTLEALGFHIPKTLAQTPEAKNLLKENFELVKKSDNLIYVEFEGQIVHNKIVDKKTTYRRAFLNNRARYSRFVNLAEQIESLENGRIGSDIDSENDQQNNILETMTVDSLNFDFKKEWLDDDDFRGEFFRLMEDQIINDIAEARIVNLNDYETVDIEIRNLIREIYNDDLEKYRDELDNATDREAVTSRLIEILRKYKYNLQFFNDLIEKNDPDQPIEFFKEVRDICQGYVDFLEIEVNGRLEDPKMYIQHIEKSKALQLYTRFKSMKEWLMRNVGPTVSIGVSVISGVVSVVIYVLEFLEENKKKIDDIRNRVKEILADIEKEMHQEQIDHRSEHDKLSKRD